MIVKDMKLKEQFIRIMEIKIKDKVKPVFETTHESDTYHWLDQLYDFAYLAGEISGMRTCKTLIKQDIKEIENIENFGKKNLKSLQ
jgi:ribosomal protein S6|tara:strand:- start:1850 stop:2107 length:258 start_codon:yes stop_codon:yes gene_type:complete